MCQESLSNGRVPQLNLKIGKDCQTLPFDALRLLRVPSVVEGRDKRPTREPPSAVANAFRPASPFAKATEDKMADKLRSSALMLFIVLIMV